jgi:hypothetical protein
MRVQRYPIFTGPLGLLSFWESSQGMTLSNLIIKASFPCIDGNELTQSHAYEEERYVFFDKASLRLIFDRDGA